MRIVMPDLMDEQTADIRTLIPKLTQQMQDSNIMQEKVFQEMTKLIPSFIKGLGAGAQDIITDNTNPLLEQLQKTNATNLNNPATPKFLAGAQAGTAWIEPFMASMTNFWNSLAGAVNKGSPDNPQQRAFENIPLNEDLSAAD